MGRLSELYARRLEARHREIDQKLQDIAEVLRKTQAEVLGVPYPPASRPGEAPHKRTGRLQRESTVTAHPERGTVTFEAPTPYAQYLKPTRPWQAITFARAKDQIEQIERRKMPFGDSD